MTSEVTIMEIESSSDDDQGPSTSGLNDKSLKCRVCGQSNARKHYGSVACTGCKIFFRRALMQVDQIECVKKNQCDVSTSKRTSCRGCRFKKCLAVGMKPDEVRPSRAVSKRQKDRAMQISLPMKNEIQPVNLDNEEILNILNTPMKTLLMTLLNIEARVVDGDCSIDPCTLYPLSHVKSIREVVEQPDRLKGYRTRMRYVPYREADSIDLRCTAYRRIIAALDWVRLTEPLVGPLSTSDKLALVRNAFGPLMVFKFSALTALATESDNQLCLCNYSYVKRNEFPCQIYHLAKNVVPRVIDQLITPYRKYKVSKIEDVLMCAIIVLNPIARGLSESAFERIMSLRSRIVDILYTVIKYGRKPTYPGVTFGNILLSLPVITSFADEISENMQVSQCLAGVDAPLILDLFTHRELPPTLPTIRELSEESGTSEDSSLDTVPSARTSSTFSSTETTSVGTSTSFAEVPTTSSSILTSEPVPAPIGYPTLTPLKIRPTLTSSKSLPPMGFGSDANQGPYGQDPSCSTDSQVCNNYPNAIYLMDTILPTTNSTITLTQSSTITSQPMAVIPVETVQSEKNPVASGLEDLMIPASLRLDLPANALNRYGAEMKKETKKFDVSTQTPGFKTYRIM